MGHQDESSEHSDSLLRRLLNQDQEPRVPDDALDHEAEALPPDAMVSPIPGYTIPARPERDETQERQPTSPIRPTMHDDTRPQSLLTPIPPERTPSERTLTPREQMQRAEEALINLRQKTARIAAEFSQGKLNRAQFDAIYARYNEQRDIIERLLARDPESQAWQSVAQPGHTTFLKDYFEAKVISYAIYNLESFDRVSVTGPVQLERTQLEAVLRRLKAITHERGNPGPAHRQLKDERSVLFVPGEVTVAVAIFSLEPSTVQVERVRDIHHDFERANLRALRNQDYTADRLVFPHRALFEETKY